MRVRAWITAALAVASSACRASDAPTLLDAPSVQSATNASMAVPNEQREALGEASFTADGGFPADYCQRAGARVLESHGGMADIARGYEALRVADCRTAGLLPSLDTNQTIRWLDYLVEYSRAMAGCTLYQPVPGGILAFGPANTDTALGIEHPALGPQDVAALIEHYLAPFASVLMLSAAERDAVAAHLRAAAEPEIESAANGAISLCPDAGN